PPSAVAPPLLPVAHRMSWLSRMLGGKSDGGLKPQRLDYLNEALALERQGDFDAALTSYRLALRDHPNDPRILQNMAIAFSRTGRLEEAVRAYRRALELDPQLSGAHYGLAFLQLKRGDTGSAMSHLTAFLETPPTGPDADRWIRHARQTLDELRGSTSAGQPEA
ncbi:MAG TPA: tetratricopeptide repeat protein, partial [Gemmatimonadaceae bacterium]